MCIYILFICIKREKEALAACAKEALVACFVPIRWMFAFNKKAVAELAGVNPQLAI